MAGTTNSFSSNLALGLSAAPQGLYEPGAKSDTESHFNATQFLSSALSDATTVKLLFLVAVTAGKFIAPSTTIGEAIGITASGDFPTIGFLLADVAAGQYGIVCTRGVNKLLTGLTPGGVYYTADNGGIALSPIIPGSGFRIGFASNSTTLICCDMFYDIRM